MIDRLSRRLDRLPARTDTPGATPPRRVGSETDRTTQVVLAYHRYGRGKVIVLPIQDSWIWQMHAEVDLEDQTHEIFWRQLIRWLADGVPHRVGAQGEREVVEPGQSVGTVRSPGGDSIVVPLDWAVDRDGHYNADFTTSEPGLYEISVQATRGTETLGTAVTYVHAAPSDDEYFDASMRGTTLRRIAEETGGLFYTPDDVASLPEDISLTGAGVTLTEERDLWDMPILLILLLSLMAGEWGYRRKRSLV